MEKFLISKTIISILANIAISGLVEIIYLIEIGCSLVYIFNIASNILDL